MSMWWHTLTIFIRICQRADLLTESNAWSGRQKWQIVHTAALDTFPATGVGKVRHKPRSCLELTVRRSLGDHHTLPGCFSAWKCGWSEHLWSLVELHASSICFKHFDKFSSESVLFMLKQFWWKSASTRCFTRLHLFCCSVKLVGVRWPHQIISSVPVRYLWQYWLSERTVRHIDDWAESTTPYEWAFSRSGTALVWLRHPDSCIGGVTSFMFELVVSWFKYRAQQRSQLSTE